MIASISGNNADLNEDNNSATDTDTVINHNTDGIDADTEGAAPNNGEGNFSGIPDNAYNDVASLPTATSDRFITIDSNDVSCLISNIEAIHFKQIVPLPKMAGLALKAWSRRPSENRDRSEGKAD